MTFKTLAAALALTFGAGAASAEMIYVPGTTGNDNVVGRADFGASDASDPGSLMLARNARVNPGEYSDTEMLRIDAARRDGDTNTLNLYLSHENRTAASDPSAVTPGEAQIAARLGLDPAAYTMTDLVRIQALQSVSN